MKQSDKLKDINSFIELYLRGCSKSYYHDNWIDWIYLAEYECNISVNKSIKEIPFFINYGFHPSMNIFI